MNETKKSFRLTKAGTVILVFTLIFSTLLTVLGIVDVVGEREDDDSSYNGIYGTYWAYDDETKNFSASYGEYYEIKFSPNYNGNYSLLLDGAYIIDITDSYGYSVYFNTSSSSYYDYAYSAYLSSSSTYTIRIYTTSYSVSFLGRY